MALNRRDFLQRAILTGAAVSTGAIAGGSLLSGCGNKSTTTGNTASPGGGGGKGNPIRIGFIPLTDCASVVMAHELGFYKKHGVDVEVIKQVNWAATRDNLLNGEIQAAHCLFGMPFSVYTGASGPDVKGKELPIAMVLNANGQAITLKTSMAKAVGYNELGGLKAAATALGKQPTFAMTYPGGTHDMWLRYWVAAQGLDATKASKDVAFKVIPPPQMVANMEVNNMDGYCVGEPWNGLAVKKGIGYTAIATQDIWKDHPEKALVCNKEFATDRKDDLRKVMMAILEASAWLDNMGNRARAAKVIGGESYVKAPADVIDARLMGQYDLGAGLGKHVYKDDSMMFHKGGAVNMPMKSHALWFMEQYVRFGLLPAAPDYKAVANTLILSDLYAEVASKMKLAMPTDMKPFTVALDKKTFDPTKLVKA
ncbi:MAG TPA: CmpA/NrtA family ABC transporter substrate-binding protein [Abditibacteriaceae bacterium]|jgi:nitrate/nitrite transport system substrate-binding protein